MPPSTVLAILLFLPALALDDFYELDSVLNRLQKMNDLQEIFDEIPREGGRAVITLGIIPLLQQTDNIERFLELNQDFASEFGTFARTVIYLADLYLSHAELGPVSRKVLENAFDRFANWLVRISQHGHGLITYDANEDPPEYVHPGVDPSTEDLRAVVRLTFHKSEEMSKDAITGGELLALVTAPTRLLVVLCFIPADMEPSAVEDLTRTQRYIAAVFRLSFRHPQKMQFEDAERELVVEYIERTLRETRKGENWETAAEALARIQKWKRAQDHQEL